LHWWRSKYLVIMAKCFLPHFLSLFQENSSLRPWVSSLLWVVKKVLMTPPPLLSSYASTLRILIFSHSFMTCSLSALKFWFIKWWQWPIFIGLFEAPVRSCRRKQLNKYTIFWKNLTVVSDLINPVFIDRNSISHHFVRLFVYVFSNFQNNYGSEKT
jgi:hypothetical protein